MNNKVFLRIQKVIFQNKQYAKVKQKVSFNSETTIYKELNKQRL